MARGLGSGDIYYKGKMVQVSPAVAHQISLRAAEIIRRTAPRGEKDSRRLIRATWQRGQIGIHVPPEAMHLVYLDQGIQPRIMKELEGKTIPIRTPGGIVFRRAKNVGKPQVLARDERGRVNYTKLSWRFPGVEAMNFIQPAIRQAIQEYFESLKSKDMMAELQAMPGSIGEFFRRFQKRGA
jgi:hypothetical protein